MSPAAGLRSRFFSTLRSHVVSRVAQAVTSIALVPYVLAHLSRGEYGLWSWLLAMSSWLTLADLGLSYGNVNPLAAALAAKDERRVGETVAAALALQSTITLVVFALAVLAKDLLVSALPPDEQSLAFRTLALLIAAQGLVVVSYPFAALLSALQRLDLVHKIQTSQFLVQAVGTVAILALGGRVYELAWLQVALGAFQMLVRLAFCLRLHPSLRLAWARSEELPGLVSSGLPVLLLGLTGTIALNFERTFLGFVVDLALLAQYAVAARLVMAVREAPLTLLSALIPTSAALDVAGESRSIEKLYARSFRLSAIVVLTLTAIVWVSAPSLLRAWLGAGFEDAGRIARPLALAFLVPLLSSPAIQILTGRSRLGRLSRVYGVWGAIFVVANAAWLGLVGFAGAGWGTAVINLAGIAIVLRWIDAHGGFAAAGTFPVLARVAGAAIVATIAGQVVVGALGGVWPADSRADALLLAVSGAGVALAVQGALAWAFGVFEAEDARLVGEALGLGRGDSRG